jgi:REP element-mobilizing transposase RayT
MLRGNAGDPVFFDESDRCRFYLLLQEGAVRFGFRAHAFCCMTNHIHLALQVGDISLSRIMQNLSLRYTAWVNRRRRRTGHVFQGRYKALLVDADSYLLELVRYIHLNPVRANVVDFPENYPWSGHQAYLGEEVLPWLTTDLALRLFSADLVKARNAYAGFVNDGLAGGRGAEFHKGTCEGRILGDDGFVDDILSRVSERDHRPLAISAVIEAVCSLYGLTLETLRAPGKTHPASEGRALIAWLVRDVPQLSLTELGGYLDRDVAALSQAARRLATQAANNTELAARCDMLQQKFKC